MSIETDAPRHVICYHNRCSDGMMAAYIAKKSFDRFSSSNVEFIAINPKSTPSISNIDNAIITLIDVIVPRESLIAWSKRAIFVKVLDHHLSAKKEVGDLKYTYFDLNKCGASLAWHHYFPGEPEPWFITYTEDRDTGRMFRGSKLEDTKAVNTYLINIPLTLSDYEKEFEGDKPLTLDEAKEYGKMMLKMQDAQMKWILPTQGTMTFKVDDFCFENVPVINSSILQSELGAELAKTSPCEFGVVWYTRYDERYGRVAQVSLRSRDNFNVAQLAELIKQPSGEVAGGHKNASGFVIAFDQWMKMLYEKG